MIGLGQMSNLFHSSARTLMVFILLGANLNVAADPLFESDELLEVTIQGALPTLIELRDDDLVFSGGTITYIDGDQHISVPVRLQARGRSRLNPMMCSLPPLRLLFEDKHTPDTLFAFQTRLKMVVQCRPERKEYEDYLLSEYLSYQLLNMLTPNSYKTRLARIRYLDNDGQLLNQSYAFFLESHNRLAKRINRDRLKVFEITVNELDREHLNLISVYQYMISHLDWAATRTSTDECCHNGRLFGDLESKDVLYIPYDFDQAGLIDAEYALVSRAFRVSGVRDRRYSGYCSNTKLLPDTLALFKRQKQAMLNLIDQFPYLRDAARTDRREYLASFFDVIEDPVLIEKNLERVCYDRDDV